MEVVIVSRTQTLTGQSTTMVASTPANPTAIVASDYNIGNWPALVRQATDKTLASYTVDSATYNAFTLNATGLGNISKTGVTKFGIWITADFDNVEPTVGVSLTAQLDWASAEETLAGDKRPKLVVTHTSPAPAFVPKMLTF